MRIINPLAFLLFSVSVLGVALNPNKYSGKLPKTLLHTAIPAHVVEHVVLGFKLIAADGIWIRLIQDLDYKDEYMASVRKGWAFRMADIITDLDKRYRIVYLSAGTVLSVGTRDVEGASLLFEKGEKYVKDWSLFYRAGYHFLYEAKNCSKAAHYFLEAVKYGAPAWIGSLAARIYSTSAQYELALQVLNDNIEKFSGTEYEALFRARKKELEKTAKNQNESKTEGFKLTNKESQGLCR
jgi:hypothetical protein